MTVGCKTGIAANDSSFAAIYFYSSVLSDMLVAETAGQTGSWRIEMNNIRLKVIDPGDASAWMKLSHEYDGYIEELVGSLTAWYNGSKKDDTFSDYMNRKIQKKEAVMALDNVSNVCLGVVAISMTNNRITFFGISRDADFTSVSQPLIEYALKQLDRSRRITVNIIRHKADIFERERKAFSKYNFTFEKISTENGIPVESYCRKAD